MFSEFDQKVKKIQEHFQQELNTIRTNHAHPALVANLMIMAYGSAVPLAQLANISVPEARLLVIEPWDKSLLKEIEKAIVASSLRLSPTSDGNVLRLKLPDLTEESRRGLTKTAREKLEQARVALRQARDDEKKEIERQAKGGQLTEDDRYDSIEELDKKTKEAVAELEKMAAEKEREVMTI